MPHSTANGPQHPALAAGLWTLTLPEKEMLQAKGPLTQQDAPSLVTTHIKTLAKGGVCIISLLGPT